MRTAGQPKAIRLTPDRDQLSASGNDLSYVLVEAIDNDGVLCPLADNLIKFEIKGPAEIAAVGDGNPLSLEPFQSDKIRLFYGKAMLILRPTKGSGGNVAISATSRDLAKGAVEVSSSEPGER